MTDGQTLRFGTSGKPADDALAVYVRETESEWKQSTGMAVTGGLEWTRLIPLSAPIVSWERYTTDRPDGVVLQPDRGTDTGTGRYPRETYDVTAYERYVGSDAFGLYGTRGEGEPRWCGRGE